MFFALNVNMLWLDKRDAYFWNNIVYITSTRYLENSPSKQSKYPRTIFGRKYFSSFYASATDVPRTVHESVRESESVERAS